MYINIVSVDVSASVKNLINQDILKVKLTT